MIRCALILLTAAVLHAQQPVEGTGAPAAAGKRLSVNSSYLLGWSSVISQDIILPLRRKPLSQDSQVVLNRVVNVFVSLFVLFWGVWYVLPGPVYFYLNITATLFLAGAFSAFIGGLEPRQCLWSLLRTDWRGRGIDGVLLQNTSRLRGDERFWIGGRRNDSGLIAGRT
jgi:hypothetical protein